MKNVRHSFRSRRAAAILLLFVAAACDDRTGMAPVASSTAASAPVTRLMVASDLVTLKTGDQVEIALPGDGPTHARVLWSSDDASIADVDNAGTITARGVGSTTVTVSEAGKATDILVTVLPAEPDGDMEAKQ